MDYPAELTAQQRAVVITLRLLAGERMTTRDITDTCGYSTTQAARFLIDNLSAVLPLTDENGVYFIVTACTSQEHLDG